MKKLTLLSLLAIVSSLTACYYDVEEELYPSYASNACDTVNVSYSQVIEPMLRNACYSCHGSGIGLGNVTLEGYSTLQVYIANGSLLGSVEQVAGFSPMPKGGTPLSRCNINKLGAWIRQGSLNN